MMPIGKQIMKCFDTVITFSAGAAFNSIQFFNKYRPSPSFIPRWSEKPLQKSWEKTKPVLGFPRSTDSLCPECVREARDKIINGEEDYRILINEHVGEIKAQIIERDGQVWMIKDCPKHGRIEDIMAIDSKFLAWIEKNFHGRDIAAHNDKDLHNHGTSTIQHGRGSVLTVDLTNPLQHDVRPVLHGCQPGGLRPRADLAGHHRSSGQRHENQAPPADVGAVFPRRAHYVSVLPRCRPLFPQAGLQ